MSKAKIFSKIIKAVARLLVLLIKIVAILVPRLAKPLFQSLSKRLRFSITFKTTVMYSVIFSLTFLIISIIILSSFGGFLLYESKDLLQKNARVVQGFIEETTSQAQIKKFAEVEGITVHLLDEQREIMYQTEDNNFAVDFTKHTSGVFFTNGNMYVSLLVQNNGMVKYILVSKSLDKLRVYVLVLLAVLAGSYLVTFLIMVVTGFKNLKNMLKPIDDMITTTKSISAYDLKTRLNVVDSHDELKELAETFNQMLERIHNAYELQNRFVSDASHELRTPIAVIQGYANLLQRWGKEEKDVLDESVAAIKNETDNMKVLVEKLLFLARADKDTQKLEKTLFSLNELVDEVVRETRLIAPEHRITSESNAIVSLEADRGLLKQALRIFIDNSIKYSPPGGTISINSYLGNKQVQIWVEDNGIGISAEDLPYVFNRFYKCDKSRTRESGGTGLGLSIAKWIIEKHRGVINIESTLNQGTKITIKLPMPS